MFRLLVCFLALATPVWGAPRPIAPAGLARVEVGATVEIPLAEVRDADEMELVLSLDGGATFPVRVTAEIEPGTTSIAWRVPNLPSRSARLALRAGADGRESIRAIGAAFAIEPDPLARPEDAARVAGEWRTREARDASPADLPEDGLGASDSSLDQLFPDAALEDSTAPVPPPQLPRTGILPALRSAAFAKVETASDLDLPRDRPRRE